MSHRIAGLIVALVLQLAVSNRADAQTDTTALVAAVFADVDRADSPGCALGVMHGGELVYANGYGMADLERGLPIGPRTAFYMASVSKQFTAASLALLAQRGRLSLSDDVRRYAPELPPYADRITLRHLIHHTSGLRDYLTLMSMAGLSLEEAHTPEEILRLVARQRDLNFQPGDRYLYSNTGYFLIPLIVERVTGASFRDFTQHELFTPLGMTGSHFHDDYRHPVPDRALSYVRDSVGGFRSSFLREFDQVGSGGLLSNVEDLVRWDENFYTGTVGGRPLVDLLHTPGILSSGDTLDYAFGLEIGGYKGLRTVSHGGSMMGFRTHLVRFPDRRLSIACLCNLGEIDPGARALRVADIYLADAFDRSLTQYAGRYRSDELQTVWDLTVQGGDFLVDGEPARSTGVDAFRTVDGFDMAFVRSSHGTIDGFVLNAGRARGIGFTRLGR